MLCVEKLVEKTVSSYII